MKKSGGVIALNEAEVNKKLLEIKECSSKIKAIFNKIDDQMDIVKANYSCSSASTLWKQYKEFNDNYSVIVNNILSYYTDLTSLKKKYLTSFDDLSQKIKKDSSTIKMNGPKNYKEVR